MIKVKKILKSLKSLLLNLIGGIIGVCLILIFFDILGRIVNVLENNFWLMIPLSIGVIALWIREINK